MVSLSGITYTFVTTDQPPSGTPEPGTLPLLTAVACTALIAFKLRRGSPACQQIAVGQAIVFRGLPSSSTVRRRQTTIVCATPAV